MSIPSDFDPLAWGERRYIQPVMKNRDPAYLYHNAGITDENYPYSFKMEVDGTCDGNGALVWYAFRG